MRRPAPSPFVAAPLRQQAARRASAPRRVARCGSACSRAARLAVLVTLVAVACGEEADPGRNEGGVIRPTPGAHVILISLDTLRADHLSCYGYARDTSPNLDAFARDALLFENVYTSANNTGPAHMTMMTGLRPPVHGIDHTLPARRPSSAVKLLAEQLSDSGYGTRALADGGFVTEPFGFERGFDVFESELKPLVHKLPTLAAWIAAPTDQPTFLFLHTYEAHAPYAPRAEHDLFSNPAYEGWFSGKLPRFRELFARDEPFDMGALEGGFWPERRASVLTETDRQHCIDLYDGDIHQLDAHLGEIFGWLEDAGRYDDAWIVITSDHGEAFREHGTFEHRQLYNSELHVPLIIRPPGGVPGGVRVPALGRVLDIAPTILWALDLPPLPAAQGRSLLPLDAAVERRVHAIAGESEDLRAVIWNDRKLIRRSPQRLEYYDLARDPAESSDVAGSDAPPPWTTALRKALADLEAENESFRTVFGEPGEAAELSREQLEQLIRLGYIDGGALRPAGDDDGDG